MVRAANDTVPNSNEIDSCANDAVSGPLGVVRDVFTMGFASDEAVDDEPHLGRITDGLVRK